MVPTINHWMTRYTLWSFRWILGNYWSFNYVSKSSFTIAFGNIFWGPEIVSTFPCDLIQWWTFEYSWAKMKSSLGFLMVYLYTRKDGWIFIFSIAIFRFRLLEVNPAVWWQDWTEIMVAFQLSNLRASLRGGFCQYHFFHFKGCIKNSRDFSASKLPNSKCLHLWLRKTSFPQFAPFTSQQDVESCWKIPKFQNYDGTSLNYILGWNRAITGI